MTVYQWLTVFGVPSLVAACVVAVVKYISAERKRNAAAREKDGQRIKALELGVQALLRAQMINDYNKWIERHYAPVYAKDNFENVWEQYHALGANGVMDGIHAEFMALPTIPTTQEG